MEMPQVPAGRPLLLAVLLTAIALLLCFALARDSFWLDEIWPWFLMQTSDKPSDVFTRLQVDNNHLLNIWYLYCCGNQPDLLFPGYFLVSVPFACLAAGAALRKLAAGPMQRC